MHHRVLNDAGDIRRGPRPPHARQGQHAPWPGTHAAVRPATPEGGYRKAPDDKESTRWGLHLPQLISLYKGAIGEAEPQGKFIHNRVAANTLAYCGQEREVARTRGAELLDWYRQMQRVREARN